MPEPEEHLRYGPGTGDPVRHHACVLLVVDDAIAAVILIIRSNRSPDTAAARPRSERPSSRRCLNNRPLRDPARSAWGDRIHLGSQGHVALPVSVRQLEEERLVAHKTSRIHNELDYSSLIKRHKGHATVAAASGEHGGGVRRSLRSANVKTHDGAFLRNESHAIV